MAELAGDGIPARASARGKTFTDPPILAGGPFENGPQVLHPAPREVPAIRHHAHADHVVMLPNVPKPTLVRNVSHSGGTFINTLLPLRAFVVSPDRNLVEKGIAYPPAAAR